MNMMQLSYFEMSTRLSQLQKHQRSQANAAAQNKTLTNEQVIVTLENQLAAANDELFATKLHLEAERNGRIAAHNQLHTANLFRGRGV